MKYNCFATIINKITDSVSVKAVFPLLLAAGIFLTSSVVPALHVSATGIIDYNAEAEARKSLPVESNGRENWPAGPLIGAQAAILMEINTGAILYEKNIHDRLFPASTTKILTALIAMEKSSLDETITFSNEAVTSINWKEDSNMGIKPGESITMEQALFGLLVGSANEAGNAIGEHISGSTAEFAALMNERAKELGCSDSNFVTTNGIFDEEHYTSAHDMALIAQAFFSNDLLCKMSDTAHYTIPASSTVSQELVVHCKNKLLPGKPFAYEYLVGSKTGYTAQARQTLVSCAQKDGMKLVCVIMKEESPNQYQDTVDLFNYGFNNFKMINIAEADTKYNIGTGSFFDTSSDVFGDSQAILTLEPSSAIVLPNTVEFTDTDSTLTYEQTDGGETARIDYTYKDAYLGSGFVNISTPVNDTGTDNSSYNESNAVDSDQTEPFYVNVKHIIIGIAAAAIIICGIIFLGALIRNYSFSRRRRDRLRWKQRRASNRDINFDQYKDDEYNL